MIQILAAIGCVAVGAFVMLGLAHLWGPAVPQPPEDPSVARWERLILAICLAPFALVGLAVVIASWLGID